MRLFALLSAIFIIYWNQAGANMCPKHITRNRYKASYVTNPKKSAIPSARGMLKKPAFTSKAENMHPPYN